MRSKWAVFVGLIVAVLLVGYVQSLDSGRDAGFASGADTHTAAAADSIGADWVQEHELPREAKATLALIDDGGPYPYRQDDGVFGNRERLLPSMPAGYYREYTVETPGEDDRGARRLVVGREGEVYYTRDHYASFRRVERDSQ